MPTARSPEQKRYRKRANQALAHHRLAQPEAARWFLLQAMVSNIYLLPRVFGEPLPRQPIWHWSNEAEPEWLEGNEAFLDAPADQERVWIRGIWENEAGVRLREGYLRCFRRLEDLREPDARGEVLAEWQALLHEVLGERPGAS